MKKIVLVSFLSLLISTACFAEQKVSEGIYEVHYNAFTSTFLPLEVAKAYQIGRSKNRGLLNISVLKNMDGTNVATKAKIEIKAKNLLGQDKKVDLQEIVESEEAVYYLGKFAISDNEDITFNISVVPEGSNKPIQFKYAKEFFTQ
ncbi:DUF4426 domain-containing protein [Marinicella sp. W31]|uniref:DUF4426 domain-containing protein n=1 Tax=Marinicella sp. W31 TaxID=3023713 RepID=UPI0037566FCE